MWNGNTLVTRAVVIAPDHLGAFKTITAIPAHVALISFIWVDLLYMKISNHQLPTLLSPEQPKPC